MVLARWLGVLLHPPPAWELSAGAIDVCKAEVQQDVGRDARPLPRAHGAGSMGPDGPTPLFCRARVFVLGPANEPHAQNNSHSRALGGCPFFRSHAIHGYTWGKVCG